MIKYFVNQFIIAFHLKRATQDNKRDFGNYERI